MASLNNTSGWLGFGNVQVGSAARFKTPADAPPPLIDPGVIATPPAPGAYQGLQVGPQSTIEYEANQTTPIDGSASLLRTLSPFVIQVEPPLAYASQGEKSRQDFAGLLDAGHGAAPAAFQAARNAITAAYPGGSMLSGARTVEQFVAMGQRMEPRGSDGVQSKNDLGQSQGRVGTPAIADVYAAADINMQLMALVQTPPLVLLINPQSLSLNYTKVQQFTDRTRFGFVFQAWGEEQPKLSVTARCGAFISGSRGVQWASRRDSAAWQNLATAFHFYKNNGYIFDTVGKSNAHHFVGALSIHYDGWVYYGNMESFTYTYDDSTTNGGVNFSFEFTVNAMVDTSKSSLVVTPMRSPIPSLSDPRYMGMNGRSESFGVQTHNAMVSMENLAQGGQPVVTGGGTVRTASAPASAMGFQSATTTASTIAPAAAGKPTPFRVGR